MNKKIKIITVGIILACSINIKSEIPAYAMDKNTVEHFNILHNEIKSFLNKKLTDEEKLKLAILYRNNGEDQKAENLCLEIIKKSPENYSAIYFLGDLYKRNYQLETAKNEFLKIPDNAKEYKNSLLRLLEIYVAIKDEQEVKSLLNVLAGQSDIALYNTAMGIYNYSALKLAPTDALINFEKAFAENKDQLEAIYYLGSISLDRNKREEARKYFNSVIEKNFYSSGAHAILGYLEFIDGQMQKGVDELKTSLLMNPMDVRGLTSFGNGMTDKNYQELEKDRHDLKGSEEFIKAGLEAVGLINLGKNKEARNKVKSLVKKYPKNIHSYIQAGSLEWSLGNYEESIKLYKKAREISNEYGLANNGLSVAIKSFLKSQEKNIKNLDLDSQDYSDLDIDSLKKVFINYNDLTDKYRKIVIYCVYPFKNYLPVLAASGSTHYIIPLYEKSTDYKQGQYVKNQRSFDLRLWDDIRGRGGFDSATGIEDLQGAYFLDFNTLTHEFTHQVHQYGLTKEQQDKIKELFNNAKKINNFMDYYSASNEYEYFAQGVEAYNSPQGKLTLKATAKNTRELLLKTDKPLFDYIVQVIQKTDMKENFASSYTLSGDNYYYRGDFEAANESYQNALKIYPDYYQTLNNMGNMYRYWKTAKEAKEVHQKAIEKYPSNPEGYLNIGDDDFYLTGDYQASLENYGKALSLKPNNQEAFYRLANAYYQSGDTINSIKYYKQALELEPNSSYTYLALAYNYSVMGNFDKANESFLKSFEIDRNSPDAHSEFAKLFIDQNMINEAEKELELAFKIEKENIAAISVNAFVEIQKNEFGNAINYLKKAIKLEPENQIHKIRLAYAYTLQGKKDTAKKTFESILKYYNSNELPKTVYDKEKNKYFSYNIKDIPTKSEFYYYYGLFKEKNNDINGSISNYKKSLELSTLFKKPYLKLKALSEKITLDKDTNKLIIQFDELSKL